MAQDVKQTVLIPELNSEKEGRFELVLHTGKHPWNPVIESAARGQFVKNGMVTHAMGVLSSYCGDFSKVYAKSEGRATQGSGSGWISTGRTGQPGDGVQNLDFQGRGGICFRLI